MDTFAVTSKWWISHGSFVQAHYKEEAEPVAIFSEEALQEEDDIQDSDGEEDSEAMKLEG